MQARKRWLLVLASVLLATASYAPLDLGWLAWVALVPLLCALPHVRNPVRVFCVGWTFGVLHWGWTITWIGSTVVGWADTPWGWAAWAALSMIKAGWFGLFALITWWLSRRTRCLLRAGGTAAAWTAIEWLRAQGGLAMPWSLLGYTQYRYLPLIQVADVLGVFGVTFAIAWSNAVLAAVLQTEGGWPANWRKCYAVPIALTPALAAAVYGAIALAEPRDGPSYRVSTVQPNIASYPRVERTPEEDLSTCARAAEQIAEDRPQLVVWPESIAPESLDERSLSRATFARFAAQDGAYHLVGANRTDAAERDYNSAYLFSPSGPVASVYDKRWLVPFGEWIPGRSWLPFGSVFHFYKRDVVPGSATPPFAAAPARVGVLICFESVFPILSREHVRRGANLLASITNDSWSGPSKVLRQHLAMIVFRGVETRRWVAVSGTTGVTGFVDPAGRTTLIEPYRLGYCTVDVRLLDGTTPYVRFGDWFVLLCALVVGIGVTRRRFDAPADGEVQ